MFCSAPNSAPATQPAAESIPAMAVEYSDEPIPFDWENMDLKIPEGEQRLLLLRSDLFSVEYVQVFNRRRQEGHCSIYGEITCSNEGESVATLYKRSRDDPDTINLANPRFQSLTLSDDGLNAPPVIYAGFPILVKVNLFEKKQPDGEDQGSSSKNPDDGDSNQNPKEEDSCIVDITFRYDDFFGCYDNNKRFKFEFKPEGESGFVIHLAHAFVSSAFPVAVHFTINDLDEEGQGQGDSIDNLTGKRKRPIDIYGSIVAVQEMGNPPNPGIELFYKSKFEPGQVSLGSPIHLHRTFLVAPVYEGFLYIIYTLYHADNHTTIADGVIPFPVPVSKTLSFVVDKDLCHTRHSKDGRISISLKFLPADDDKFN